MTALLESVATCHGASEHRLEALVGLAKLKEHRQRRLDEAESLTRQALILADVAETRGRALDASFSHAALLHRLDRVRRRRAVSQPK